MLLKIKSFDYSRCTDFYGDHLSASEQQWAHAVLATNVCLVAVEWIVSRRGLEKAAFVLTSLKTTP